MGQLKNLQEKKNEAPDTAYTDLVIQIADYLAEACKDLVKTCDDAGVSVNLLAPHGTFFHEFMELAFKLDTLQRSFNYTNAQCRMIKPLTYFLFARLNNYSPYGKMFNRELAPAEMQMLQHHYSQLMPEMNDFNSVLRRSIQGGGN